MIKVKTKIRKLRNSVIPLKKENILRETFGTHKFRKSVEQIMD